MADEDRGELVPARGVWAKIVERTGIGRVPARRLIAAGGVGVVVVVAIGAVVLADRGDESGTARVRAAGTDSTSTTASSMVVTTTSSAPTTTSTTAAPRTTTTTEAAVPATNPAPATTAVAATRGCHETELRVSVSVDKSQYLQGETLHATVTKEVVGPERCVTPAGESLSVWDNQNHGASVDRSQCAGSCVFSPNQPSTASIDLALTADRFPPGPYMVMHTWGEAASAMLHITVVGA